MAGTVINLISSHSKISFCDTLWPFSLWPNICYFYHFISPNNFFRFSKVKIVEMISESDNEQLNRSDTHHKFWMANQQMIKGCKLNNLAYFRLKFCPYTRHKYCWLLPHYNGIPSDRSLERIDAQIEKIRTSTFSDTNGDQKGGNRPLEWKSKSCDETSISVEERKLHWMFQRVE
jgi:hypothetical protein